MFEPYKYDTIFFSLNSNSTTPDAYREQQELVKTAICQAYYYLIGKDKIQFHSFNWVKSNREFKNNLQQEAFLESILNETENGSIITEANSPSWIKALSMSSINGAHSYIWVFTDIEPQRVKRLLSPLRNRILIFTFDFQSDKCLDDERISWFDLASAPTSKANFSKIEFITKDVVGLLEPKFTLLYNIIFEKHYVEYELILKCSKKKFPIQIINFLDYKHDSNSVQLIKLLKWRETDIEKNNIQGYINYNPNNRYFPNDLRDDFGALIKDMFELKYFGLLLFNESNKFAYTFAIKINEKYQLVLSSLTTFSFLPTKIKQTLMLDWIQPNSKKLELRNVHVSSFLFINSPFSQLNYMLKLIKDLPNSKLLLNNILIGITKNYRNRNTIHPVLLISELLNIKDDVIRSQRVIVNPIYSLLRLIKVDSEFLNDIHRELANEIDNDPHIITYRELDIGRSSQNVTELNRFVTGESINELLNQIGAQFTEPELNSEEQSSMSVSNTVDDLIENQSEIEESQQLINSSNELDPTNDNESLAMESNEQVPVLNESVEITSNQSPKNNNDVLSHPFAENTNSNDILTESTNSNHYFIESTNPNKSIIENSNMNNVILTPEGTTNQTEPVKDMITDETQINNKAPNVCKGDSNNHNERNKPMNIFQRKVSQPIALPTILPIVSLDYQSQQKNKESPNNVISDSQLDDVIKKDIQKIDDSKEAIESNQSKLETSLTSSNIASESSDKTNFKENIHAENIPANTLDEEIIKVSSQEVQNFTRIIEEPVEKDNSENLKSELIQQEADQVIPVIVPSEQKQKRKKYKTKNSKKELTSDQTSVPPADIESGSMVDNYKLDITRKSRKIKESDKELSSNLEETPLANSDNKVTPNPNQPIGLSNSTDPPKSFSQIQKERISVFYNFQPPSSSKKKKSALKNLTKGTISNTNPQLSNNLQVTTSYTSDSTDHLNKYKKILPITSQAVHPNTYPVAHESFQSRNQSTLSHDRPPQTSQLPPPEIKPLSVAFVQQNESSHRLSTDSLSGYNQFVQGSRSNVQHESSSKPSNPNTIDFYERIRAKQVENSNMSSNTSNNNTNYFTPLPPPLATSTTMDSEQELLINRATNYPFRRTPNNMQSRTQGVDEEEVQYRGQFDPKVNPNKVESLVDHRMAKPYYLPGNQSAVQPFQVGALSRNKQENSQHVSQTNHDSKQRARSILESSAQLPPQPDSKAIPRFPSIAPFFELPAPASGPERSSANALQQSNVSGTLTSRPPIRHNQPPPADTYKVGGSNMLNDTNRYDHMNINQSLRQSKPSKSDKLAISAMMELNAPILPPAMVGPSTGTLPSSKSSGGNMQDFTLPASLTSSKESKKAIRSSTKKSARSAMTPGINEGMETKIPRKEGSIINAQTSKNIPDKRDPLSEFNALQNQMSYNRNRNANEGFNKGNSINPRENTLPALSHKPTQLHNQFFLQSSHSNQIPPNPRNENISLSNQYTSRPADQGYSQFAGLRQDYLPKLDLDRFTADKSSPREGIVAQRLTKDFSQAGRYEQTPLRQVAIHNPRHEIGSKDTHTPKVISQNQFVQSSIQSDPNASGPKGVSNQSRNIRILNEPYSGKFVESQHSGRSNITLGSSHISQMVYANKKHSSILGSQKEAREKGYTVLQSGSKDSFRPYEHPQDLRKIENRFEYSHNNQYVKGRDQSQPMQQSGETRQSNANYRHESPYINPTAKYPVSATQDANNPQLSQLNKYHEIQSRFDSQNQKQGIPSQLQESNNSQYTQRYQMSDHFQSVNHQRNQDVNATHQTQHIDKAKLQSHNYERIHTSYPSIQNESDGNLRSSQRYYDQSIQSNHNINSQHISLAPIQNQSLNQPISMYDSILGAGQVRRRTGANQGINPNLNIFQGGSPNQEDSNRKPNASSRSNIKDLLN